MAVAMRALDARVETRLPGEAAQTRTLDALYRLPGETPHIEHRLAPGELITAILLPPAPAGRQGYRKVRDRASYAFALISVAAIVSVEDGHITQAALAFGGVGTMPWRNREAEALLIGQVAHPALFERCADAVLAEATGHRGNDFKIPLLRRTLVACLAKLTGGEP
jgi:xanthine dehydrogenase YagS FAD-binding subunit